MFDVRCPMSDVRCLLDAVFFEVSGVIETLIFTFTDRYQDIGHRTSDIRHEKESITLHVIQSRDILRSTPNRETIRGYET
jgi:hypothetical protein